VLAGVVALDKRNLSVVGRPLDGLRAASGKAALGEDVFNSESSFVGGLRRGWRGYGQKDEDPASDSGHRLTPKESYGKAQKCTPAERVLAGRSSGEEMR